MVFNILNYVNISANLNVNTGLIPIHLMSSILFAFQLSVTNKRVIIRLVCPVKKKM